MRSHRLLSPVFATIALALVVLSAEASPASAEPGVRIENGIVFATHDGVSLKLDAYLPTSSGPHPGVILIHGGGWYTGLRGWDHELGVALAGAGFAGFGVDYRLAPEFVYPAQVEDLQTAVRWVRAHASEFDVDPERVGALGESAGGHLAALLAVLGSGARDAGSRVEAAVSLSGPMDLSAMLADRGNAQVGKRLTGREAIEQFLGCRGHACAGPLRDASPLTYVDASDAPMLLANSTHEVIPLSQATEMAAAFRNAHVPFQLLEIPGTAHGFYYLHSRIPGSGATVLNTAIAFLRARLGESRSPAPAPPGGRGPGAAVLVVAIALAGIAGSAFLVGRTRAKRARVLRRVPPDQVPVEPSDLSETTTRTPAPGS